MALVGGLARLAVCLLLAWNQPAPGKATAYSVLAKGPGVATSTRPIAFLLPALIQRTSSEPAGVTAPSGGQKAATPCGGGEATASTAAAGGGRYCSRPASERRHGFGARAPPATA